MIASLFAAALTLLPSAAPGANPVAPPAADGRVVVLGFDGADARTVEAMMARGELPHLARLAAQGTFAPLGTTIAAESPVAWASLNTGHNPAKTGIAGFVSRTYSSAGPQPDLGLQRNEALTAAELELSGPLGWLSRGTPTKVAAVAGGAAFVVFFLVFAALLRLRALVSAVVALLLAGIGAYGVFAGTRYVPDGVPASVHVANPLDPEVPNFWDAAGRAGKRCVVLDAAMAWDRPVIDGVEVLAGLGVPDSRGQYGQWFIYTDAPTEVDAAPVGRSATAGTVFKVRLRDDRLEAKLYGIENFWRRQQADRELARIEARLVDPSLGFKESQELVDRKEALKKELAEDEGRTSVPLVVERLADDRARVKIGESEQTLSVGQWSDFYRVDFELNPLLRSKAITRVKLLSLREPFKLFVNSLDIDPEHPADWQPISQPNSFARALARKAGRLYETFGWACITMAYKDEEIDVDSLLEDVEFTLGWREALLDTQLESGAAWDLLFAVFSTPDRVQHMTYHFHDPQHPLHDPAAAARVVRFFGEDVRLADAIPAIYRQVDRIVGKVLAALGPNDTLLLCADHGFQSFRRQVNLNNWLYEHGYLVLKPGATRGQRGVLQYVDWSRTKAYALGLGSIYLNLADREPDGIVQGWQEGVGIVDGSEAALLIEEMERKFLETVDPRTGEHAFTRVYVLAEHEKGKYRGSQADLMPGHAAHYRVSWGTTLGDIHWPEGSATPGEVFTDNDKTWSGGHVSVDPELVRGIFFSSRPLAGLPENGGVHLEHLAPTALALLGVPVPASCDRPPLEFR